MQIEQIVPEPAQARAQGQAVIYTVPLSGEAESTTITFDLRPQGMGPTGGQIEVLGGQSVNISQFIYP